MESNKNISQQNYSLKPLVLEATDKTPFVRLDKDTHNFEFRGNMYPEDIREFFRPILNWIDLYIKNPSQKTYVDLQFEYLNSSSEKMVFYLIEKFQDLFDAGYEVIMRWYYETDDEEMYEEGLEISEKVDIPFEFYEVE